MYNVTVLTIALARDSRFPCTGVTVKRAQWSILDELGRGRSRGRKRGWGVQKWRERVEVLSSAS